MVVEKKSLVSVLRVGGPWDSGSIAALLKLGFVQELTVDGVKVSTPGHVYVKYEDEKNAVALRDKVLGVIEPFNQKGSPIKNYVIVSEDLAPLLIDSKFVKTLQAK
jgi:hypothetical protein